MRRLAAAPLLIGSLALAVTSAGTAVAGHVAFSDAAGTHEAGIHWLADTGITGGCGGDRFCTDDSVKRGQMATFLHKLSGTASIPPVVNADKVDGLDAEQLRGQQGPAGPPGAGARVEYVDRVVVVDESTGPRYEHVPCPDGTRPVSGAVDRPIAPGGGWSNFGGASHETASVTFYLQPQPTRSEITLRAVCIG